MSLYVVSDADLINYECFVSVTLSKIIIMLSLKMGVSEVG
jgi:hypothetical protein